MIENSLRPGGSGRGSPLTQANFCDFFLHFPLATLIFPENSRVGPHDTNYYSEYNGVRVAKHPESQRKFKIFTEKSEYSYEILK